MGTATAAPPPGVHGPRRRPGRAAVALLAAAALGAGTVATVDLVRSDGAQTASVPAVTASSGSAAATAAATAAEGDWADVYAAVAPSVVDIAITTPQGSGEGSGVVLDRAGNILTNEHVVGDASRIVVTFSDGATATATVVGTDPSTDLAVVRVQGVSASALRPITLGSSADLRVGDPVMAVGNPFGYEGSASTGIVSGLGRTIQATNGFTVSDAIQTDAAINHGSSGGALVDASGRLVGITAQIADSGVDANVGVGFAVPVDTARAVADGLVVFGTNAGRVFALDADTGEVVWARRQKGYIASSPAIEAGLVYVTSMDGRISVYGSRGGRLRWRYSTGGSPIESSPLVVDDEVYFGAWNGTLYSLDRLTGKVRWTFGASGDIKGSAALAGDLVVVADYGGVVHGVRRSDGAEVWRAPVGARFYGGPAVSGGKVVIGDVGGAVVCLDATTGREVWRHSTGAYVYSSPAIADGTVFIGSYAGSFQALDLDTGAERWSFDVGGRISGSATVVDGVVYTAVLSYPGEPKRTWGLDTGTGAVRYRGDDGRYSPAVGAGRTLYLVGTRTVDAYPAPKGSGP